MKQEENIFKKYLPLMLMRVGLTIALLLGAIYFISNSQNPPEHKENNQDVPEESEQVSYGVEHYAKVSSPQKMRKIGNIA